MFLSCSENLQPSYDRTKEELKDKIEQMIQDRRMKIEEIRRSAAVSKQSAERCVSASQRAFHDLQQSIRRGLENLLTHIEEKQKSMQKQADSFLQELEQEILQLTQTSKEVEQPRQPLPSIPKTRDWEKVSLTPPSYGRELQPTFTALEQSLRQEKEKLINQAKLIRVQEFSKDVTLDPDTANAFLVLSPDGKKVHRGDVRRDVPDNRRRFETACNVLGGPSCSSGRFYFEVRVEGLSSWDVGVASEEVQRRGSVKASPDDGLWSICLRDQGQYKAPKARLCPKQPPRKVGVFVDYDNASVFFFDADTADVLHRFDRCSFPAELRPFFSPGHTPSAKDPPPQMVICPVIYHL